MPRVQITTLIDLDLETGAKWFASLDDDQMCRFLVLVAEEAKKFDGNPDMQWYYLGGHLRNCKCSTPEARDMIKKWAEYAATSDHN